MPILSTQQIVSQYLIGRAKEQTYVAELIARVRLGHGEVLLMSGDAGIGKTRLAAYAKSTASEQGFLAIQGTCFPGDRSAPYALVAELLASWRSYWQQLAAAGAAEGNVDPGTYIEQLPHLLERADASSSQRANEQEQVKRRVFAELTQSFVSVSARQPVLITVEDLQWCDEVSLEFLHMLARVCAQHPLLLVLTYRSDENSLNLRQWLARMDHDRLMHEVLLAPLSRADTETLLRAILTPFHLPQAAVDAIYERTEGNPFFVEEILKSLLAADMIPLEESSWDHVSMPHLPIPRSIQAAVFLQLDRVSAAARHVALLAAVAGKRFDFALLQRITHHKEPELLRLVKELIATQLVVEESEDRFAFRHPLIRETLYSQLLLRERKRIHRTIAGSLEMLWASSLDAHLTELAHHTYEAGLWPKAMTYAHRAGEQALRLYAPHTAALHLTRALDAAQRASISRPASIYLTRGQAHEILGDFESARADYDEALTTSARASDAVTQWQSVMALGSLWTGRDYGQAGVLFHRALDLANNLGDLAMRARSLNRLGNWLSNTGHAPEALRAHDEALRLFEAQADVRGMAETFDLLGITYGMVGDRSRAVEQLGQAIALFRTLGDKQSLASSLAMRAVQSMPGANETTYCPLSTRDACVQDAEEALRLYRAIDSLAGQAFTENALAHVLLSFGELGPALAHAREAVRIAADAGHQQWMVASAAALGHIYLSMLAPAEAIAVLDAALSRARSLGSAFWISTLATHLGRAYRVKGDLPASCATLQSIMPRDRLPHTLPERQVALVWGELALAQGEAGVALEMAEHLLASVPGADRSIPSQPVPHVLALKGEALLALARLEAAVATLEDARQGAIARNARPIQWTIHRALGRAYQRAQRKEDARREYALGRQLINDLARTIDDASLRDRFLTTALASFPAEKPLLPREEARLAFGGLTARQREVALLIARGKTSREIADLLVVSERTAEAHVSNILRKLEFSSRAQIAAWIAERGLEAS